MTHGSGATMRQAMLSIEKFSFVRALVVLAMVGCGGESQTPEGEELTAGTERPAGGGDAGSGATDPGGETEEPGDPTPDAGTPTGEDAGPAAENPWGTSDAESGEALPERRQMAGAALEAYRRGVQRANAGDYEAASRAFTEALEADGNAFRAAYNLGVVSDRLGRGDDALRYYRQALRIQPDYERALEGAVAIYVRRGQATEGVALAEPIARRWVRNLAVQAVYGDVLVHANRTQDAIAAARGALRRDERFVPAMLVLVKANLRLGRLELAESILDQALAIDERHAEANYLKGRMLQDQNQLAPALARFRTAVESRPDYPDARLALGLQLLSGANYDEALTHFEQAARMMPDVAEVHLNLGDAYRSTKQWTKAKTSLDRALQMNPNLAEVHYNLALMYMAAGADFPGMDVLTSLQRAQEEFTTYRTMMGSRLKRDDASSGYLEEVGRSIERTKRALARDAARRQREAERAARAPAEGAEAAPAEGAEAAPAGE